MYVYTRYASLSTLPLSVSLLAHASLCIVCNYVCICVYIVYMYVMSDLTHLTKASLCS